MKVMLQFHKSEPCLAVTALEKKIWLSMVSDCLRVLDNRPLKFEEFEAINKQFVYVSATPADYELEKVKE